MNKDNKELNDSELNNITGAGESFNNMTIGNIEGSLTPENITGVTPSSKTLATAANKTESPDVGDEESNAYKVGFFPGLSGFP